MKCLVILLTLVTGTTVYAQSESTSAVPAPVEKKRLVTVPFEDRLFVTDLMGELMTEGQNAQKVANELSNSLQMAVGMAVRDSASVFNFLNATSRSHDIGDLKRIRSAVSYRYVPLYSDASDSRSGSKSAVRQGQLSSDRDTVQRYMAAFVNDTATITDMSRDGWADHYLFLTQLEVRMDLTDPEQAMLHGLRTIAVHYTLTDASGTALRGGIARHDLKGGADITRIRTEAFPAIAGQLSEAIFPRKKKEGDGKGRK